MKKLFLTMVTILMLITYSNAQTNNCIITYCGGTGFCPTATPQIHGIPSAWEDHQLFWVDVCHANLNFFTYDWSFPAPNLNGLWMLQPGTHQICIYAYSPNPNYGVLVDCCNLTVYPTSSPFSISSPDLSICLGSSVTLDASVNQVYDLSTTASIGLPATSNGSPVTFTPTQTGTYYITFTTHQCGSQYSQAVPITIKDPTLTLTGTTTLNCSLPCTGTIGASTINGYLPYTYTWTPSNYSGNSLSALCAGYYSVTVTDQQGCTDIATYTITESHVSPTISANVTHIICGNSGNGSINSTVSNGTAPYTYYWSNSSTSQNLTGISTPGTYSVTVTDANGCTASTSIDITQTNVTTSCTNFSKCFGENISFNIGVVTGGGTTPYTYLWSDGTTASTITVNPTSTTTYTVTVTDQNGCSNTASSQVTVIKLLPDITTNNPQCYNSCNGSMSVNSVANSTGTCDLFWSNGTNNIAVTLPFTQTGLCSGSYSVTVYNSICHVNSGNYVLTQPTPIKVNLTPVNIGCSESNTGSISTSVTGGVPGYIYQWTGPNSFNSTNSNISSLAAGTYYLTVADANGCMWTGSQTIIQDIFLSDNWPANLGNVITSGGDQTIHDMVTDAAGNVYVIGIFTGTYIIPTTPSPTTLTNPSNYQYSIFVAKYDRCGNPKIARNYGGVNIGSSTKEKYFIENATTTTIAVAGVFSGIDFVNASTPTMTSADGIDVFVATLSTNTLLATTATQRQIFSSQLDNVKGLSVYLNAIYVTGGFRGKDLFFSGFPTKTLSLNSTPDLYIARYNANLSALTWSQNYTNAYSEQGMTMKVNGNLYFTYMQNNYSYISRVTPSNGVVAETQQIGTGTEFYNINDMENIGSQLYLCGYQKGAYTNTVQKSAIIHYAAPLSSIAWPPSHVIASNTWTANNEASKIVTDGTNIFVSGSFDCATPFRFGVSGSWSQIIALQGTSNHYVYKTNNILTPNIGWLAGVASAPTTAASFGNALAYDANNAVFYLGGPYNGNNITLTGSLAQVLPNSIGFDGFIARFQDNGSVADYKSVEAFEVTPIGDTEENNVTLYPNPSSGIFKVASTNNEVITEIAIADLTGRIVYRSNSGNIVNDTEINTDFLSNGTYLVSVSTELNNYKLKLLIVK